MTPLLESVISEIFNKFDIGHKKYLTYEEFKAFQKVITEDVTSESQFKEYLKRYQSTGTYTPKPGMTLLGLKMFFFEFIRVKGQSSIWVWDIFQRLGYDEDLQSVRSRSFTLSLHASLPVDLKVQDALQTDLDHQTSILIMHKFSKVEPQFEKNGSFELRYTFSDQIFGFSYFATNKSLDPIELTVDLSKSTNMVSQTAKNSITKRIEPGATEFMIHQRVKPDH